MANLRFIIEAVEENNEINDGKWSDWDDSLLIFEVYVDKYDSKYCSEEEAHEILDRAIASDGASLKDDVEQLKENIWGDAVVIPDTFLTKY